MKGVELEGGSYEGKKVRGRWSLAEDQTFQVTGIESYLTVLGAKRTVLVVRPQNIQPFLDWYAGQTRPTLEEAGKRIETEQVLMQIMRHENIETTLKYYVGRNAQTTAKVLWKALPGNSIQENSKIPEIPGVF